MYVLENTFNAKRGGRQFSMFMSKNICTIVDLFDKTVAEVASNHCENEVVTVRLLLSNDSSHFHGFHPVVAAKYSHYPTFELPSFLRTAFCL